MQIQRPKFLGRLEAGRVIGSQGALDLSPDEEQILPFLDGRSLDMILRAGLELKPRLQPLKILGLLRRLYQRGLLEGVDAPIFGPPSLRIRGQLPLPALRILSVPGKLLPQHFWSFSFLLALLALLYGLLGGPQSWNPIPALNSPLALFFALILFPSMLFSFRSLFKAWMLRSFELPVPRAFLRLRPWGVYLAFDLSSRRAASAQQRLKLALGGLASLCFLFAFGRFLEAPLFTGVVLLLLLLDLAPYLKTDAWHIAGILTGIPKLRRRTLRFLIRQVGRNLRRSQGMTRGEWRYLILVSSWLLHGLLLLSLLGEQYLPTVLRMVAQLLVQGERPWSLLGISLLLFLLVVVLSASLVGLIFVILVQLLEPKPRWIRQIARVEELRAFRRAAEAIEYLRPLAQGQALAEILKREPYQEGELILRQGDPGDRLCFLAEGRARVEWEEESGLIHGVAELEAHSFFGEIALVSSGQRNATVRAMESALVLSISQEDFKAGIQAGEEIVDTIRAVSMLRRLPGLTAASPGRLSALLARCSILEVPPGVAGIEQGEEEEDGVYLIEVGRVLIEKEEGGSCYSVAELGPGDWFGEVVALKGGCRTATVRAVEALLLHRIPAEAWREILVEDMESLLRLDRICAARLEAL